VIPDFQYDPVEYWASRILTWALIFAILVVLYSLVLVYRRETQGMFAKGLLFVGVVALPAFSITTGMLLALVRAERVEFCASCHRTLQPYVDDMRNGASEGLAAVHFRNQYIASNQCYECHTSYGLFGTLTAKVSGVGQVVRYYTGTYDIPLRMREPYSNGDCLKCHAASQKWLAEEEHTDADMQELLFSDEESCMSCHEAGHLADLPAGSAG
jgi:nitrate/TMAO reductase-like tetraheme cytochrome c subunit